jgi:proliferating cell nuclear antigen
VIKTITTSDAICLKYSPNSPFSLDIIISGLEKRNRNKYTMQLLDIRSKEELDFHVENFDTILQMQSYYFQKTCKDILNTGGSYVEILTNNDHITFRSKDSLLASELSIYETQEGLRFKKRIESKTKEEDVCYGVFQLKSLITFTKCTTLCPVVTLYLMKNYPLVLQYNVASLGLIRFCIASLKESEK